MHFSSFKARAREPDSKMRRREGVISRRVESVESRPEGTGTVDLLLYPDYHRKPMTVLKTYELLWSRLKTYELFYGEI